jgi:predicted DNA-binding ribbon-helix-helix protein
LELQCTDEVAKALVSNRLTREQGTSRNEAVHKKFWQEIRRFGGNRSFELLQLLIDVIVFKHNGTPSKSSVVVHVYESLDLATCMSHDGVVHTVVHDA